MDCLLVAIGEYSGGKDIGNFEISLGDFFLLCLLRHFQIGDSGLVKNQKGIPS